MAVASEPQRSREVAKDFLSERRIMDKNVPIQAVIESWPGFSTPGWDSIDEAGWESFPASDPPAVSAAFRLERRASLMAESEPMEAIMFILEDTERHAL